jgi:hypothetical protein
MPIRSFQQGNLGKYSGKEKKNGRKYKRRRRTNGRLEDDIPIFERQVRSRFLSDSAPANRPFKNQTLKPKPLGAKR